MLATLSAELRQYLLITANYWAFTLTDGALRMLVVLHFHQLGYSALDIALLFLFYELFGIITNLIGGWLGARIGLNKTMNSGLLLQVFALSLLLVPNEMLSIAWVMLAQALSGIAKDLNKMSAKSAIKALVPDNQNHTLYRWVALLTGSKNALKGLGFFMGGLLLTLLQFKGAILFMAAMLFVVWLLSVAKLKQDLGKAKQKPQFSQLFSKSRHINYLSAARLFLFSARDVWFVVALPVFLSTQLNWAHWQVGSFLACWIIAYGIVQALSPKLSGRSSLTVPNGKTATLWVLLLSAIPALIALAMQQNHFIESTIIIGLFIFGFVFAINSSIHSFLIVHYAKKEGVSLDIGFYYMANAAGRLSGTLLSGWIFQAYGLAACLLISSFSLLLATVFSYLLSNQEVLQG